MSKISRHEGASEQYGVMQDWLVLFAHELEKQGYLDYLKPVIHRKHFNSIDEKMADIKERIGFDVVSKLSDELEDLNKQSDGEKNSESASGDVKTAGYKHPEKEVIMMANILKYATDMAQAEPHLSATAIISRCREAEGLGYNTLRIDEGKLKKYIETLLDEYDDYSAEEVRYEKREIEPTSLNSGLDQADYYSHARPETL